MKQKLIALTLVCALLLPLLASCSQNSADTPEDTIAATEATIPETTPPDGNPDDVTCLGSYSVSDDEIISVADHTVASVGDAQLTNGLLQVYYWLEVAAYRQGVHETEPDFSRPLDTQVCPIDDSVESWQQYFLREALNAWHAQQALILQSQQESFRPEAEYKPDLEKHREYMVDKPAAKYLYGYNNLYQPNEMHQAYLDTLPQTLEALALGSGFTGVDEQAAAIAGPGADREDVINYSQSANLAYMYLTELGYHLETSAEDVERYYADHQTAYEEAGIRKDGSKTVNIRHILLLPEDAEVAADGTVTASEDSWNACLKRADEVLGIWKTAVQKTRFARYTQVDPADSRFSETAKNYSADAGSSANGGLYVNLRQGQLNEALDSWCFDSSRQHGDVGVIRSHCGVHILFFRDSAENWYTTAQNDLLREQYQGFVASSMEKYPITIQYSHIALGQAEDNGSFLLPSDLLYPDIAHERYPSVPLYLQQDYPEARYGEYKLSSHGCGITTLAMVASYMTDQELTPTELATTYGYYCGPRGTEIILFDNTPAELGFHLKKRTYNWDEMDEALRNGQIVVSLQGYGYWTRGGHYIALTQLTEDGKYVVRDSNLLNYNRISAHVEDCHTRGSISSASQYYWVYEKKVTSIAACARCGTQNSETPVAGLFREDYHCAKCLTAMTRRDSFLTSPAG